MTPKDLDLHSSLGATRNAAKDQLHPRRALSTSHSLSCLLVGKGSRPRQVKLAGFSTAAGLYAAGHPALQHRLPLAPAVLQLGLSPTGILDGAGVFLLSCKAISSRAALSRAVENISDGFVCICLIRQRAGKLSQGLAASLENTQRSRATEEFLVSSTASETLSV